MESLMQTYGFESPDFVSKEVYEDFRKSYEVILERRCTRWKTVIDQGNLVRGYQLKRFCRKGVPAQFRSHVWMTLSGAFEMMRQNPKVYHTAAAAQLPKTIFTTIMADIPRTFPENAHFSQAEGKGDKLQALQRILVAFAVTFPKIGYCQGLNYVAATLLLAMQGVSESEAEERAFWLLYALSHHIVPDYYSDSMVNVRVDCLVFEELLKKKAPNIYQTLKNANVDCVVLATKWFICLFADVLPIETVLRIFDSLFYEGNKILFRACIALAKLHTREILYCQQFPDVVLTFRDITQDKQTLYCHEFLKAMFTLPGSLPRSLIRKLRGKCLEKVKITLSELEAQERDYHERMALQLQQQQQAQQKDEEQPTSDSQSEEFDDSDGETEVLKPIPCVDDAESSPSLNAPANHGNSKCNL
ncbi:Growth hormone-regulated TBC protein 1 [Taenia crassiceps]|uniref:Growth hormone-regulated TBC protein 1 n=1 Tax=Taenia crassiceps TaxID=6207 RepID=A0ABR4QPA3_9CEST